MKKLVFFLVFSFLWTFLFAQSEFDKAFIGITIGPSISLNNFAKNGYSDNFFNFGYKFYKKFGICASVFYSQYNEGTSGTDNWWGLAGLTIGPMYSMPIKDKFHFDLKAKFGYVTAQLVIDDYVYKENVGNGLGFELQASLRYNFTKRWGIMAEAIILHTNQKFFPIRQEKIKAITFGLGIAYNFNFK